MKDGLVSISLYLVLMLLTSCDDNCSNVPLSYNSIIYNESILGSWKSNGQSDLAFNVEYSSNRKIEAKLYKYDSTARAYVLVRKYDLYFATINNRGEHDFVSIKENDTTYLTGAYDLVGNNALILRPLNFKFFYKYYEQTSKVKYKNVGEFQDFIKKNINNDDLYGGTKVFYRAPFKIALKAVQNHQPVKQPAVAASRQRTGSPPVNQSRGAAVSSNAPPERLIAQRNLAVVIGIGNYQDPGWKPLANPVYDARAIRKTLVDDYGYEVIFLQDPTKDEILAALDSARQLMETTPKSISTNMLIYLAGHGGYDAFMSGYLVPANARNPAADRYKSSCISHSQLRDMVDNIPARHTLVILDACYGGTFDQLISRGDRRGYADDGLYANIDYRELVRRKDAYTTRLYLTSGGKEYVPDGRPGQHSPFTARLFRLLVNSYDAQKPVTYRRLCAELEALSPEPRSGDFGRNDAGSDFILVPKSLTGQAPAR